MVKAVLIGFLILGSVIIIGLLIITLVGISVISKWLNWRGTDMEEDNDK